MTFKIWDNEFGGYMRDVEGREAVFRSKIEADRAIELFICRRDRQDEWLCRLDVEHADANICYHLGARNCGNSVVHFPVLRPIDYCVPTLHWKLLSAEGGEMKVGMVVRTRDGESYELAELDPPHKMAASGRVTCVDPQGRKNWWYAGVIGGTYRYMPPEDDLNSSAIRWASERIWKRVKLTDIPVPRGLLLPPPL